MYSATDFPEFLARDVVAQELHIIEIMCSLC